MLDVDKFKELSEDLRTQSSAYIQIYNDQIFLDGYFELAELKELVRLMELCEHD